LSYRGIAKTGIYIGSLSHFNNNSKVLSKI